MTYQTAGQAGLREVWSRTVDPRRVPGRWLVIALLLPVVTMAGAVAVAAVAGPMTDAVDVGRVLELIGNPLARPSFALFVLIFGPVPEEIGWRGYALDALQARWSALGASLLLGAAWVEWTRTGLTAAVALLAVGLWSARTLGRRVPNT